MLLKRTLPNILRIKGDGGLSVRINPGMNDVTKPEHLKLLEKSALHNELVEKGLHVIVKTPSGKADVPGESAAGSITEMNAKSAVAVIKETLSIPTLEEMQEQEEAGDGRKTVLKAIDKQIEEMRSGRGDDE